MGNSRITAGVPAPYWQFLLLPCLCGADEAEYHRTKEGTFRVRCCACGRETGGHVCAHDAQAEWNRAFREAEGRRDSE